MIIEKRTYTFHPGKVAEFLKLYEAEGLQIHTRYLPATMRRPSRVKASVRRPDGRIDDARAQSWLRSLLA